MAVETVFLLPGQGGYTPGILAGDVSPDVKEVLDTADRVAAEFGRDGISGLLTRTDAPSAAELVRTDSFALQLAVFAAAVAGYRIAERQHGTPDVVVGHSMGEIAALTVAGAFDPADGARLVCHRSEALLAHCPSPGGMVALELPAARAAHLVGAVGDRGLAVAVSNAPRQTVVSGPDESVGTVARLAGAMGVQATRLNAPFPFHSPMLSLAARAFGEAVSGWRSGPCAGPCTRRWPAATSATTPTSRRCWRGSSPPRCTSWPPCASCTRTGRGVSWNAAGPDCQGSSGAACRTSTPPARPRRMARARPPPRSPRRLRRNPPRCSTPRVGGFCRVGAVGG